LSVFQILLHLTELTIHSHPDQAEGKYDESVRKAEDVLRRLGRKLGAETEAARPELLSTVYSLLGNAHLELQHCDQALEYHEKDLRLAKTQ
jgi:hypothetical protein